MNRQAKPARSAIIVGGGLAGMVTARELALRGWPQVTLLERSKRLGGKAGSDFKNGRLVEHGYHVFSKCYPNVRAILERIQVKLIDFDRYHFLLPGGYPRKVTVIGPSGFSALSSFRLPPKTPNRWPKALSTTGRSCSR